MFVKQIVNFNYVNYNLKVLTYYEKRFLHNSH